MKTIRRLLYRDIVASVMFVALAFLSLFFFIDLVEALDSVGRSGRDVSLALQTAALQLPGHFYELFPIAVLIGTIFSLARMAQSSEFTILRTGGLGPGRALRLLATLGLAFGVLTFVVGDYVAPAAERQAALLQARASGGIRLGANGAWLKERRGAPGGERSISVNVAGATATGALAGIRVFEFDGDGRLLTRIDAVEGRVDKDGTWTLIDALVARWPLPRAAGETRVLIERVPLLHWPSTLDADVVAAAVLPVGSMTTLELWRYSAHLSDQEQAAQSHLVRFWRKALYPLACLVMVALALPFAYLHARGGSVSLKVFGGILLGISFVLLNNLSGHIATLRAWTPWIAAAAPSGLYLLLSMAAFAWLVRYR
ncbi:LPS export ABC transporter permease LptG [Rubrivivax sp. A210]|uniref:LPS export ABC transporter permease LptG n=1 Tax=Rubrivivax sp. A210 TaxID=2772301 RepID=UPI0019185D10|nr:LPS export ABC transporter permease LptG [Rubrivivax sp. A210]CAD5373746.1 LPS export ABC transporter permease LptG [Rubrivivax sp. A210]